MKIKRIGFLGNMNNYPFMLAQSFKKKGYEILFIITEKEKLCRPEYRYDFITFPYPQWVRDFSDCDLSFLAQPEKSKRFKEIIDILNTCDVLFFNSNAIRFSHLFKRPYFCILTGSDLLSLANYSYAKDKYLERINTLIYSGQIDESAIELKLAENILVLKIIQLLSSLTSYKLAQKNIWFKPKNTFYNLFHLVAFKVFMNHQITKQRLSIKNSEGFIHAPKGTLEESDKLLEEINVHEAKRITGLMIDSNLSEYIAPTQKNIVRIFNVARFNWLKNKNNIVFSQLDYKGNDVMIRGLAQFYSKYKIELDIVFVKKGEDYSEAMALTEKLGIDHLITWKDVLSQAEVQEEYRKADIVFDQLSNSIVSMGGLDAMAVGRPLIANSRPEIYEKILGQKTEICDTQTDVGVCEWLSKLVLNSDYRITKGKKSRKFVLKHFSDITLVSKLETFFTKIN